MVTFETDSAWVLLIAASLVTLAAAVLLRRLIRRPGGPASGILLLLPLLIPPIAALAYEHAVLPEISVLEPVDNLFRTPHQIAQLLLLSDGHSKVHMYAISGTAGRLILLVGLGLSIVMVVRRLVGAWLVHRLIKRCRPAAGVAEIPLHELVVSLDDSMKLAKMPEVLCLPERVSGAFAVWGRRPRILVSKDLLEALDTDEVEAVLAHELAHLEARDVQLVFGAGMIRDLFAWNPFAHAAFHLLVVDREVEADRRAAEVTGKPLAVASGLLKMFEHSKGMTRRNKTALAFLRPRGRVTARVNRLLAIADGRVTHTTSWAPYAIAVALVALLGLQAAARVAQQNNGAFAIVLGAPSTTNVKDWESPHRGIPHNARSAKARAPAAHPGIQRIPKVTSAATYREQDLPKWMDAVMTRVQREGMSPEMLNQIRRDWTAVPVLRFEPRNAWMGLYRIQHGPA